MRELKGIVAGAAAVLTNIHPTIIALFFLIVLDILTGLAKAVVTSSVSSDASRVGMTKKAVMLLVVITGAVVQRWSGIEFPIDVISTLATFYCVTEVISILENAKACGVPLPDALTERFKK